MIKPWWALGGVVFRPHYSPSFYISIFWVGKQTFCLLKIWSTVLFLFCKKNRNTVHTLLTENGTGQKISLREKFVFLTLENWSRPEMVFGSRCHCKAITYFFSFWHCDIAWRAKFLFIWDFRPHISTKSGTESTRILFKMFFEIKAWSSDKR